MLDSIKLRPLEREDLKYVHKLNNDSKIMSYWFEEPYESFVELQDLFDKHIHKQSERRFIVEDEKKIIGLVELVEIDLIHRNAEFQIIIDPNFQGKGYAFTVTTLAMKYAFNNLNLHKVYLLVDKQNEKAIHIYKKAGFSIEGELREEFFTGGSYRDALRMCIFQNEFHNKKSYA
ncbi:spermidine N1-acetyltransferase [Lysinibacillus sp. fkY74-1]|uniref:Spermidine N(1)-acetyltransferase n=3 Tax=Lysinibacillus TaxID=400634 RepID=W7RMD7_LYSSH|nr:MULTISPECIES: spermidine N1-acetyltransferase [Lysinibacillus]MBE5083956.1 spermidine N1-acetyltransferase [Bacillus thuringiensis]AMO33261.1 spermidine acetyltransferase [Lysinibacillus sphaericus]AMR91636.1 spermidine acetyltransferase [Lysinibacillus sphaericus]ANA45683.1 spermidine acetyltransferase [Lysinibacillus sphaericus]EWH32727.1 spermidine N1-acetyltransferase [Lysinibacillus sphaericus CBAM5]